MEDILRKKMHLPLKRDHTEGQDANGCFVQMSESAGLNPMRDSDDIPDVDTNECSDPDFYSEIELGRMKAFRPNAWLFTTE